MCCKFFGPFELLCKRIYPHQPSAGHFQTKLFWPARDRGIEKPQFILPAPRHGLFFIGGMCHEPRHRLVQFPPPPSLARCCCFHVSVVGWFVLRTLRCIFGVVRRAGFRTRDCLLYFYQRFHFSRKCVFVLFLDFRNGRPVDKIKSVEEYEF